MGTSSDSHPETVPPTTPQWTSALCPSILAFPHTAVIPRLRSYVGRGPSSRAHSTVVLPLWDRGKLLRGARRRPLDMRHSLQKMGAHTLAPLIVSQSRKAKPSYKRTACQEAPRREIQRQHSSRISRRGLLEPVIRSWLLNSTATRSTLATLLHCHLFDAGPHDLIPHKLTPARTI